MRNVIIGLVSIVGMHGLAGAQAVKSEVTASNGVTVTVYTDDFANRKEFSAPWVKVENGQMMVATIAKGGITQPIGLTGFFTYSGEWRRYNSALFKGGDPASFTSAGRNVGGCSSSRYSRPTCTLTESFEIALSPAEIRKHGESGVVAIQVRAEDTSTAVFEVPVSHFKAVAELAKVNIEAPAPIAAPTPQPTAASAAPAPAPARPRARRLVPRKR